jgi:AcrR family transcriptional regulator
MVAATRMRAEKGTALDTATTTRRPRKVSARTQLAREERAAKTREELLASAAQAVGELGYRDTSIQRITAGAGLAQGTFYLYFESRQAIFDELLPHFGQQMLDRIAERVHGARGFLEVEELGARALFEYLHQNPWFWRVLNEAEVEAPVAWHRHHDEVARRYLKFLKRARADGELSDYAESELGTLAHLLIAARDYIYVYHLIKRTRRDVTVPESMIKTYMQFIRHGLGRRK